MVELASVADPHTQSLSSGHRHRHWSAFAILRCGRFDLSILWPPYRNAWPRSEEPDSTSREESKHSSCSPLQGFDLGLSASFKAEPLVDDQGLMIQHQHPFERLAPAETQRLTVLSVENNPAERSHFGH